MKIGLFSDVHFCTKEILCNTRRPSLSFTKLQTALESFLAEKVELIICLGDLVDNDDSDEQNLENLIKITDLIKKAKIDCYCCMGNHDANLFKKTEFKSISDLKIAPLSLSKQGKLLIFLDANYSIDSIAYQKQLVNWTDSFIPDAQLEWLEDLLKTCDEEQVYIFVHQNLDSTISKNHVIINADKVREIIKNSCKVRTVYQGHFHKGANNIIDNIPYITLKAMCEGIENSYTIIDI